MGKRLTTEIFIERAVKIHEDFYNYDSVVYITDEEKVKITCPIHGDFEQRPSTHLRGCRCPKCGRESHIMKMTNSIDDFIEKANQVHNFKYTYDDAEYTKRRHQRITITCREHGNFVQAVDKHLNGQGCKRCAAKQLNPGIGFSKTAWIRFCKNKNINIAYCYIIHLFNENESFIKIGITSDIKSRLTQFPYKVESIYIIKGEPSLIYDKETELHKKYKLHKYKPKLLFGGATECFNLNIYN